MFSLKNIVKSILKIQPSLPRNITIYKEFDTDTEAFLNRLWYSGKAHELNQFYRNTENYGNSFWGAVPTHGREIRKIHTGLPRLIADTLVGIIMSDFNGITINDVRQNDIWNAISTDNSFDDIVEDAVRQTLIVGGGAFKLSLDKSVSEYPIIEFVPCDRLKMKYERGRLDNIVFFTKYMKNGVEYRLEEAYGRGFVHYELYKGDILMPIDTLPETKELADVTYSKKFIMAVPLVFAKTANDAKCGQSIFDGKKDNFDSFDEVYSQWIQSLRECRPRVYIPESLIPRSSATGTILRPNPFDNQYIKIGDNMSETAKNSVDIKQPALPVEGYVQTYMTALDLCLQGIISPSTLGIDTKKLDNAEAQREKEKTTLYTRQKIITALTKTICSLVQAVFDTYYISHNDACIDVECSVNFGEYASPSFEAVIETLSNPNTPMSVESKVEEMWGISKNDEWKAEEVKRIKEQSGFMTANEPSDGGFVYGGL